MALTFLKDRTVLWGCIPGENLPDKACRLRRDNMQIPLWIYGISIKINPASRSRQDTQIARSPRTRMRRLPTPAPSAKKKIMPK